MAQKYSIFICIGLLIASCKQDSSQFSKIPQISLSSIKQQKRAGLDSIVNIVLTYQDGDGDLGLNNGDTAPPYNLMGKNYFNLLVDVYRVDDGVISRVTSPAFPPSPPDTINFNDRIANLTPTGKDKSISGEIKFYVPSMPYPGIKPDSMFYTFQLVDRALNKSNLVKSDIMKFEF